ncbi:hypothetical protein [Sphingobium herbicidovorans]|uniref:hypothetical protein n=1 Tax=Sphingobium herbicidovorans TaxID=76947 RepID=UPI002ADDBA25|nr:hypothetical protein [Sphingobium herbicidovorans]
MKARPFLRSPPFPGIARTVAAVSIVNDAVHDALAVPDSLLDQIAQARVGGTFWGHRRDGVKLVARAGCPFDGQGLGPAEIAILPAREPSRPVDPWSLLAQARSVHAPVEDELAIIGGLLGVPVHGPDGTVIAPERLRDAARQAIAAATYRDCFNGAVASAEDAVRQLADWRRHLDGNRDIAAASGMALWKREAMRRFLWDGDRSPPSFPLQRHCDGQGGQGDRWRSGPRAFLPICWKKPVRRPFRSPASKMVSYAPRVLAPH